MPAKVEPCLHDLRRLSELLYDFWQIQCEVNMLEQTYVGTGIFLTLVVHAIHRRELSIKTLNADIKSASSAIRRVLLDMETTRWVSRQTAQEDQRVRIVKPSARMERRAQELVMRSYERLMVFLDPASTHTKPCARCRIMPQPYCALSARHPAPQPGHTGHTHGSTPPEPHRSLTG